MELDTRTSEEKAKPMTFGQELTGVDFNPAGDDKVKRLKQLAAEMADIVHAAYLEQPGTRLNGILYQQAIGEILNGQMNAVKLVTNRH